MGLFKLLLLPLLFAVLISVAVSIIGAGLPWVATQEWGAWAASPAVAATVKMVLLVLTFVMPLASLLTWMERKQSAMMQDRIGPNRAAIGPITLFGIPHFLADAIKMAFKE